jgi:hypothetical protein
VLAEEGDSAVTEVAVEADVEPVEMVEMVVEKNWLDTEGNPGILSGPGTYLVRS